MELIQLVTRRVLDLLIKESMGIEIEDSAEGTISLKAASNIDTRSTTTTDITAGTILNLHSGDQTPTSTNRINLNP